VAVVLFLVFAGFFATAQRARADTGVPASGASEAVAGLAAQVPPGSTAVPPPASANSEPGAPVDPAQPAAQDVATAQAATAVATAAQPQQSNGIGTTRTDSSGAESVSQQNDVAVLGAAANTAAASQTAGSGEPTPDGAAEADQQATSDQAANAAAAAVQPQQSNIVVIIRINSPGDDVVSQTNVVSVVGVAANQSSTSQSPAPAGESASGASDPPQSASGASSAPLSGGQPVQPSGQPAQTAGAEQQPQQPADVIGQRHSRPVRALSILAFSASSAANLRAPDHLATSPTTSAGRPRSEGAARRSGVFGSSAGTPDGSDRAPVYSSRASTQTADPQAHQTDAQGSRGPALVGAVRDRVASWLGRTGSAARPQLAADSARGMNLGILTLTALLVGLLAWAALSWSPFSRR
jgi:hypothetical protein